MAAGTILWGIAAAIGIIGALFNWPPRGLWLGLWWGGLVLWGWFGHRWQLARKTTRSS
jgi:hypothetical protein